MHVELFDTHVALLDKLVAEGRYGGTRQAVLRALFREHAYQVLAGKGAYASSKRGAFAIKRPQYGSNRYELVLSPVTGKAFPVYQGEVLRIAQVDGGQCVDFNAYNLHDYKEHLDCGMTRIATGLYPKLGEMVWSNAPRSRPMFAILEMPETCKLDIIGHRCNRLIFEPYGFPEHPNCQDTFAECIREYGLTPDDVHDSFNLWMNTYRDAQGKMVINWNPAQPSDYVDFLAIFDVLAVPIICGSSDLSGMSNFTFSNIRIEVYKSSQSTMDLQQRIVRQWSNFSAQKDPSAFKVTTIKDTRELTPDPDYHPEFIPTPRVIELGIELDQPEEGLLQALLKRGDYGTEPGEALRATLMRWWFFNRPYARWPIVTRFDIED